MDDGGWICALVVAKSGVDVNRRTTQEIGMEEFTIKIVSKIQFGVHLKSFLVYGNLN